MLSATRRLRTGSVLRFDGVDAYALRGEALPAPAVVSTAFPSDSSHGWKYIAFSPADGKLYVPVGAPCNVCEMQVRAPCTLCPLLLEGGTTTGTVPGRDAVVFERRQRNIHHRVYPWIQEGGHLSSSHTRWWGGETLPRRTDP